MSISGRTKVEQQLEDTLRSDMDKLAMGQPKISLDEINVASVPFQPYKNFFTYISMKNVSIPDQGILSAADVSKVLLEQYGLGYRVMNVVFIGAVEGSFGVFYFLKHKDA